VSDPNEAEKRVAELKALGEILGLLQEDPEQFFKGVGGNGLQDDEIDKLVQERIQAKLDKNYQRADEIRNQLQEAGIVLEDSREGTQWRRG
ncbi:MAG: CysS/YqeB C-terminal domain-containing protein, partial [bacterium]